MSKRLAALVGALPALALFPGLVRSIDGSPSATAEDAAIAGHQAHERGDWRGCVAEFERALDADPGIGGSDLHTALGVCHAELGQSDQAIAEHRRALTIDPQDHLAWMNLGVAHGLAGDLDEAQRAYDRALAIEPQDAMVHSNAGILYLVRMKPERAAVELLRAVDLEPRLAMAHANLAVAYEMLGRHDDAARAADRARELSD